jgi:hypothetical protein
MNLIAFPAVEKITFKICSVYMDYRKICSRFYLSKKTALKMIWLILGLEVRFFVLSKTVSYALSV